ncbi:hypothetical protein WR25_03515 [Diploscapter pachys]|uniref:Uncharacterized protein n=1 Tax=Diploscapter pachys TaxID=2018661 RepID=A0A2A2JC95_9BILA|nr:hypothetical protein WR25_03515 [Diploscapter pachys]
MPSNVAVSRLFPMAIAGITDVILLASLSRCLFKKRARTFAPQTLALRLRIAAISSPALTVLAARSSIDEMTICWTVTRFAITRLRHVARRSCSSTDFARFLQLASMTALVMCRTLGVRLECASQGIAAGVAALLPASTVALLEPIHHPVATFAKIRCLKLIYRSDV